MDSKCYWNAVLEEFINKLNREGGARKNIALSPNLSPEFQQSPYFILFFKLSLFFSYILYYAYFVSILCI